MPAVCPVPDAGGMGGKRSSLALTPPDSLSADPLTFPPRLDFVSCYCAPLFTQWWPVLASRTLSLLFTSPSPALCGLHSDLCHL